MDTLSLLIVPIFILGVLAEILVSEARGLKIYEWKDTRTNVMIGTWALLVGLFARFIEFKIYTFVHQLSPDSWHFSYAWGTMLLCMVGNEIVHYFFHRFSHEWRILWAFHLTHHSCKNYNLSVGHRLNTHMTHRFLFWAPLALFFDARMVILADSISLIYMFFIHNGLAGKLGPFEWIFNTPSHHRVHHGINPEYIDKNYGGILIIWDKIFGTFVPEINKPRYGITKELKSNNPVDVASQGWIETFREAKKRGSLWGALKYLFGKPD